jgi:acyl carrier protein
MTIEQSVTVGVLVKNVLVDTLGVDPERIDPDADLEHDLGLDSLDRVDLLVSLETYTGSGLSDEELASVKTVRDAIALVEQRMASR